MSKVKRTGVSPITNTIFYGMVDEDKKMWIGKKEDITDSAISSVFEWFYNQMENNSEFEIRFPDVKGYCLKMVREEENV